MQRNWERDGVRAVLRRWGGCEQRIAESLERLKEARRRIDELYEIAQPAPDGQPRGGSPGDPVFRAFERVERMRARFDDAAAACETEIAAEQAFRAEVDAAVRKLRRDEREIIVRRYRKGQTAKRVSIALGVSRATVYVREREALNRLIPELSEANGVSERR